MNDYELIEFLNYLNYVTDCEEQGFISYFNDNVY